MISDGLAMEVLEAQDDMLHGVLSAVARMADPRYVREAIHEDMAENVIYTCVEPRHGRDTAMRLVKLFIWASRFGMDDADDEFDFELRDQVAYYLANHFDIPRHDAN